jgi:hypothetical protein
MCVGGINRSLECFVFLFCFFNSPSQQRLEEGAGQDHHTSSVSAYARSPRMRRASWTSRGFPHRVDTLAGRRVHVCMARREERERGPGKKGGKWKEKGNARADKT